MSTKKILIVEDHTPELELYTEVFEGAGFNVDEAVDGAQALDKLSETQYELVLLDVNLPKIDGLEVLKQIRDSLENKDLPVLMISNLDESAFLKKSEKLGISGYIIKADHTPGEVVAKVNGILDEKR